MKRKIVPLEGWNEQTVVRFIQSIPDAHLRYTEARRHLGDVVVMAAHRVFGSWRRAVEAAGRRYPGNCKWVIAHYRENPIDFQQDISNAALETLRARGFKKIWRELVNEQPPLPPPVLRRCGTTSCLNLVPSTRKFCDMCREVRAKESQKRRSARWHAKPENKVKAKEATKRWLANRKAKEE